MKAFKVRYSVAGVNGLSEVLVVENEAELENALMKKSTKGFKPGDSYSNITYKREIPLSSVKMTDLSYIEFIKLNKSLRGLS